MATIEEACRELGLDHPERISAQLTAHDLVRLFQEAPKGAHIWVTDVFHRVIDRIPPEHCFRFWKREVKQHLMEDGFFARELWPGGYGYLAYRWKSPFQEPLIELMRAD